MTVNSTTSVVNIDTGLTVDLPATSSGPVDITVTRSTSALDSALSTSAFACNRPTNWTTSAAKTKVRCKDKPSSTPFPRRSPVFPPTPLPTASSTCTTWGWTCADGHLTYTGTTLPATGFTNSFGVDAFPGSATGGGDGPEAWQTSWCDRFSN